MTTSNDPSRKAATPSGTTPQQNNAEAWNEVEGLGEKALRSITEAQRKHQEMKEQVKMLCKDAEEQLNTLNRNVPKLPNPVHIGLTIFFLGFMAGVLGCLAVGTVYYLSRRVSVKTGGYNGN